MYKPTDRLTDNNKFRKIWNLYTKIIGMSPKISELEISLYWPNFRKVVRRLTDRPTEIQEIQHYLELFYKLQRNASKKIGKIYQILHNSPNHNHCNKIS